ncbi:MAG: hypothetical protein ACE5K3_11185, partial [bacterium]
CRINVENPLKIRQIYMLQVYEKALNLELKRHVYWKFVGNSDDSLHFFKLQAFCRHFFNIFVN